MSLSPVGYFGNLDDSNPKGSDSASISDDQHRNILASCKQQGPNWTGAITATHTAINSAATKAANTDPGYGGIRLSGPLSITPVTLTSTPVIINQYDQTIASPAVDVTQDSSGGSLTIQSGLWMLFGNFAGRFVAGSDPNRFIVLYIRADGSNLAARMASALPENAISVGGNICAMWRTTTSNRVMELFISSNNGNSDLNYIDALEFSAFRLAEA